MDGQGLGWHTHFKFFSAFFLIQSSTEKNNTFQPSFSFSSFLILPNLKSMAYLLLLAYCSTYIWSLPLFNLCVIHSYRAKNKVWSVYTTYLNILATELHWQPDNVSLLVGMPTRNKKCGSLHGANRLGARWQALECSGKLEKMLVFLAGKVSLHVVVSCAAPAASLVH